MDEIATLPITAWELRTVSAYDAVIFTPSFIANAMQRVEDAVADRNFMLSRQQAQALGEALLRAAHQLGTSSTPPDRGPLS